MVVNFRETNKCIVVYLAGESEVDGRYIPSMHASGGEKMFRKKRSNIGILKHDDGLWYISDCGEEFRPVGEDHLDYYTSDCFSLDSATDSVWKIGDDGHVPAPKLRVTDSSGAASLTSALRVAGASFVTKNDFENAIRHMESVIAIGPATVSDYVSLAESFHSKGDKQGAFKTMIKLSNRSDLLFDENQRPTFSIVERARMSQLLLNCKVKELLSITELVKLLQEKSLYIFVDFLIAVSEKLTSLLDSKDLKKNAYDSKTVDTLLRLSSARREFQLAGGLEVAMSLREFYRQMDLHVIDERDTALSRSKIFSLTDSFRQFASDGKLDLKGRDGTFKNFWEVGLHKNAADPDPVLDPREQESRSKDLDPAKEMKCSVIKGINEGKESDLAEFEATRIRLLKLAERQISLEDIHKHDCLNETLKLISIHGVVFDVTHNLEKYAPDGEYFFFPGHDITYPLAVSSLSGDHVDEFYILTQHDHLKRVYGWMSYFENKYKVYARLNHYDSEKSWSAPPAGEDEAEAQCVIM